MVECVNYALKELGFSEVAENEIFITIGLNLEHTFIKLVGENNVDKTEEFKNLFIKRADDVMADLTILFNETPSIIKKLNEKTIKLAIVSTKFRYRIEDILRRENLLNFFDVIIGGEDISSLKPDPAGLKLAIEKLELKSSEVFYIGDSITDAKAANNADIPFIAVLSGVTCEQDFSEFQVYKFLKNISELPEILFVN